ncbi:MAG: right-handed parallel beta-helix repeat-containing protein [Candidatus Bathyarchaeota archaeon]|nr:MAG: right-handed parallel beta-helix repeat-containing protein [Candidatus Bathyarchaeota archaeon]
MVKPSFTLLLTGLFVISLLILCPSHNCTAEGEVIFIRVGGEVDPPHPNITRSGDRYVLGGVVEHEIVVERDSIVVDGEGHTIRGTNVWDSKGIHLSQVYNVTVRNTNIERFWFSVYLNSTSACVIQGNQLTRSHRGAKLVGSWNNTILDNTVERGTTAFYLLSSHNNTISKNRIEFNTWNGVQLYASTNNTIEENTITSNRRAGIVFESQSKYNMARRNVILNQTFGINFGNNSNHNHVVENNITGNMYGVYLNGLTIGVSGNVLFHNWFVNNSNHVFPRISLANTWDDGHPSGGNFWDDYIDVDIHRGPYQNETGSDGIWDHPYVIDELNQDRYPIVPEFSVEVLLSVFLSATVSIGLLGKRTVR